MKATEIVKKYLEENGYSGLCMEGCGCEIGEIAPCGGINNQCSAGYKQTHSVNGMWIITSDAAPLLNDEIMEIVNDL